MSKQESQLTEHADETNEENDDEESFAAQEEIIDVSNLQQSMVNQQ